MLSFRENSSYANCNKQQKDTNRTVYAKIAQDTPLSFEMSDNYCGGAWKRWQRRGDKLSVKNKEGGKRMRKRGKRMRKRGKRIGRATGQK